MKSLGQRKEQSLGLTLGENFAFSRTSKGHEHRQLCSGGFRGAGRAERLVPLYKIPTNSTRFMPTLTWVLALFLHERTGLQKDFVIGRKGTQLLQCRQSWDTTSSLFPSALNLNVQMCSSQNRSGEAACGLLSALSLYLKILKKYWFLS